ncbi:hypothetical protein NST62_09830 [Ureibacillus sp. FSL K6-8385]|uniref:hypothetical protein n=1 Tax=Ureibacillus TaxID=160795 RepID=UPI002E20FE25|nr:hypothetical protein [Ureibacillus terrenus]
MELKRLNYCWRDGSEKELQKGNEIHFLGKRPDVIFEEHNHHYIRMDTSIEKNPEYPIIHGWSNINRLNEIQETVGYFHFKIYNSFFAAPAKMLSMAKGFSREDYLLMVSFLKHFEKELNESYIKFLVVNEISLNDPYQNKGIEIKALIELIELCRILDVDYIILKASPSLNENLNDMDRRNKKQASKLAFPQNRMMFDVYALEGREPVIVIDIGRT